MESVQHEGVEQSADKRMLMSDVVSKEADALLVSCGTVPLASTGTVLEPNPEDESWIGSLQDETQPVPAMKLSTEQLSVSTATDPHVWQTSQKLTSPVSVLFLFLFN
jgi:hypothetical protein